MKLIVNVLVAQNNKLLMVKEASGDSKGKWNFPAGHLDDNENLFTGAIREAKEETGYDVKITGLIDIQNLVTNEKHVVLIMFSAEIVGGDISFDKNEISAVEFVEIDKLLKMTDNELRSAEARKSSIKKFVDNKVYPLNIIENFDYRNL